MLSQLIWSAAGHQRELGPPLVRQSQMSRVGRPCLAENRDGRPLTSLVLGAAEPARQSDAGSRVKGPALSLRARESGFRFALLASRAAFSFPFPTREEARWRRPRRQWNSSSVSPRSTSARPP